MSANSYTPARGANSSGMVLVMVVILSVVAGILAAGLCNNVCSRLKRVQQESRFEKAFFVAEAGIERGKAALRLGATNNGVLFGGTTNYANGTFYVTTRTNLVGTNQYVIVRSTGTVENVRRMLEVELRLTPPEPYVPGLADGAICFYGTNASLYLKNANNHVNGYDWAVPADFTGNGSACDGTLTTNAGHPGVYSTTNLSITGSGDIEGVPPVTNWAGIYSETYWYQVLNDVLPYATLYTDPALMGTRDVPIVTLLPSGVTQITGNNDGAGILIVPSTARLKIGGTFHYEGLILLIGDGVVDVEDEFETTGTFDMFGSVICLGGALNVRATGKSNMKYSTEALANLSRLALPARLAELNVIYWLEIKPSSGG